MALLLESGSKVLLESGSSLLEEAVTIRPSGIASAQAFGTAAVLAGQSISPTGIASGEAFGTAKLNQTISPSGIATGAAFGSAVVSLASSLHLLLESGSKVLLESGSLLEQESPGGNQTISPSGIASGQAFGTTTVSHAGSSFDPTSYGITFEALYWSENPAWTPPANLDGVSTWPDASGQGRDVTQATTARQPGYWDQAGSLNGRPAIQGPGHLLSATFTAPTNPVTLVLIGTVYNHKFQDVGFSGVGFDGSTSSRVLIFQGGGSTTSGQVAGFSGTVLAGVETFDPHVYRYRAQGTLSEFAIDDDVYDGNGGTNTINQVSLFQRSDYLNATDNSNWGSIALAALYHGDITTEAGWTSFLADARTYYGLDRPRRLVVCDGDSRTAAPSDVYPVTFGNAWPAIIDNLYPDIPWTIVNVGVGGQTLADMSADAATQVDPIYDAANAANLCVCEGGHVDIVQDSVSLATLQTRYSTYCTARRATGYDVVAVTIPASSAITGSKETVRQGFNSWLRLNWSTIAQRFADPAADARLQNPADGTYFTPDGIHFTNAGNSVWAESLGPAVAPGIAPTGIASGEAFGTATFTRGAVIVSPTGIASAQAFGATVVSTGRILSPAGIASAQAFGTAAVAGGGVTLTPTGIPSAETCGALTVIRGPVTISPSGIGSAQAFGTATVGAAAPGTVFVLDVSAELVSNGRTSGELVGA